MSLRFTATGAMKFAPGPYQGVLVDIQKKYKQVEKDGKKEDRPYLRWIFQVLDEGFEEQTLSLLSSTSFGVGPAGPAKARRYAEIILGRKLETGEQFTPEDLYNKPITLHIDNDATPRGTFARIIEITPAHRADEVA